MQEDDLADDVDGPHGAAISTSAPSPRNDSDVDELLELLVYRHENPQSSAGAVEGHEPEPSTGIRRSAAVVLAVLLLGLVVLAIVLGWLVTTSVFDGATDAQGTTIVEPEVADPTDTTVTVESEAIGQSVSVPSSTAAPLPTLRIGVIGPSAADDGSFTQGMVDGLGLVADERDNIEIEIVENASESSAAVAVRSFADDGFDLVIAHSSAFMTALLSVADEYPDVTFAIGTVEQASGRPNVYTYAIAAEEGGFVLGALAARLTESDVVGAVGPVEVGTSQRFIDGFHAGAHAEREELTVFISYTGSFSDGEAAATAARGQIENGADVITGHGHDMGPAMAAADSGGARWLANQASPALDAPKAVVASQVYRWDVVIRSIIADIDSDGIDGRDFIWVGDLANGGLVLHYDPDLDLDEATRQRLDELVAALQTGLIDPLAGT